MCNNQDLLDLQRVLAVIEQRFTGCDRKCTLFMALKSGNFIEKSLSISRAIELFTSIYSIEL